ncbi:hypothetical protein V6Z12_D06G128100 [Gossypium hirsutum]
MKRKGMIIGSSISLEACQRFITLFSDCIGRF